MNTNIPQQYMNFVTEEFLTNSGLVQFFNDGLEPINMSRHLDT